MRIETTGSIVRGYVSAIERDRESNTEVCGARLSPPFFWTAAAGTRPVQQEYRRRLAGQDSRSVAPRGPERIADFRLKCSNQVASRRIRRPSAFITLIGTSKENE
jgi:hypothetical protein